MVWDPCNSSRNCKLGVYLWGKKRKEATSGIPPSFPDEECCLPSFYLHLPLSVTYSTAGHRQSSLASPTPTPDAKAHVQIKALGPASVAQPVEGFDAASCGASIQHQMDSTSHIRGSAALFLIQFLRMHLGRQHWLAHVYRSWLHSGPVPTTAAI